GTPLPPAPDSPLPADPRRNLRLATNPTGGLIAALPWSPAFRPSPSGEGRVVPETISNGPTWMTTSAITFPSFTDLTVPANWFLALSMAVLRSGVAWQQPLQRSACE